MVTLKPSKQKFFKKSSVLILTAACAITLASCATKKTVSNSADTQDPETLAYASQTQARTSPISTVLIEDEVENDELISIEPAKIADPLLNGQITPLTPANGQVAASVEADDPTSASTDTSNESNIIAVPNVEMAPETSVTKPTETAVTDINKTIETPIVVETPTSDTGDEDELCIVTIDNDCSGALVE
ncbi:MAG: hypothetical protein ABJO86_09360 [Lentilitoribacter sp.]